MDWIRRVVFLWLAVCSARSMAAVNVVVILDDSGSMQQAMQSTQLTRMAVAKRALSTVIQNLPDDTSLGIYVLNGPDGRGEWIVPLAPLQVEAALQQIAGIQANGGTPLGAALKPTAEALLQRRAEQHYGEYRLLVVSDGEANDPDLVQRYLPLVQARAIRLDVIGVDMRQDLQLAQDVDSYRRADDAAGLEQALTQVLAESSFSNETAEADFALLNGFPSEVALAVIESYSTVNNDPLPELPAAATYGNSQPGAARPVDTRPNDNSALKFIVLALVAMMVLVAAAAKRTLRN